MPRVVPLRGVVEGFYGAPWGHDARRATVELLGAHGMNAYVYAPKDEPKHRAEWRTPYDAAELARFRALAEVGRAAGVEVGFAISPGLDVDYRGDADRGALLDKLGALRSVGVRWFVLALDDIPLRPGLAAEQADLVHAVADALGPDATRVTLCPTEYVGTRPTEYLSTLASALPRAVDVLWTGPTVCSPTIRAEQAAAWARALGGRRPLLWDNFPVNDATMSGSLHLGPYEGREPALTDEVDGVLLNPMTQARSSGVAVLTAAEFLRDPAAYNADAAWARAIEAVGGGHARPFGVLARACSVSALRGPERLPLRALVDDLDRAGAADGPSAPALAAITAELLAARHAARDWAAAPDDPLGAEVRPWLEALEAEAATGLAALRVVAGARGDGPPDPEVATDAEVLMQQVFVMLFRWSAAREQRLAVYGPRFSLHPAVVQLADGRPGLDVAASVLEDGSAVDRLCRLALRAYAGWTTAPDRAGR